MRRTLAFTVLLMFIAAGPAAAVTVSGGQAEAKEAARAGGCTPAKVEVLRHLVGRESATVFKVGCNEDKDAFVLVECRARICTLLR